MKAKKRLSSFITAVMLVLTSVNTVKTESVQTVLSTADDVVNFTSGCISDSYSIGREFILMNDIDMEGYTFKSAALFCGRFNGNGHTISNIDLSTRGEDTGFFAKISSGAVVENLNIEGKVKTVEIDNSTSVSIGDIVNKVASEAGYTNEIDDINTNIVGTVGILSAVNEGKILNCNVSGDSRGVKGVGGLVGTNKREGLIEGCVNDAEVSGDSMVGGIVGKNIGRIRKCKNRGIISKETDEDGANIGGIAGFNDGVTEQSENSANVGCKGFGVNVGGIVGKQSGVVDECVNYANVSGRKNVGGILGMFVPYSDSATASELIKDNIRSEREKLDDDIEEIKDKLSDKVDELLDGKGFFSRLFEDEDGNPGILAPNGVLAKNSTRLTDKLIESLDKVDDSSEATRKALDSTADALDKVGDASDKMANSVDKITDSVEANSKSLDGLIEKANDSMGRLTDSSVSLSDKAKEDLGRLNSSVTDAVDSFKSVTDEVNEATDSVEELLNTLDDSAELGIDDRKRIIDEAIEKLDSIDTDKIDDTLKKLGNASEDIGNSIKDLNNGISSDTSDLVSDITAPLKTFKRIVDDSASELNRIKTRIASMKERLKKLRENIKDDVDEKVSNIVNTAWLDPFTVDVYAAEEISEDNDVKNIVDKIIDGETLQDAVKDVINIDISLYRQVGGEDADNALVRYCINNGSAYADSCGGGIVGFMGVESLFKQGEELTFSDGTPFTDGMSIKAVVEECVNKGSAEVKKDNVGGIVGSFDMGIVKNCLDNGKLNSTEGGFVGGIAGYAIAEIEKCVAISELGGKSDVGGIVGKGRDITLCYAMPTVVGTPERVGAVAGSADGTVTDNYYIDEGLGGISGAGYGKSAEPLKPSEMVGRGILPTKMEGFTEEDWFMQEGDSYLPQIRPLAENTAVSVGAVIKQLSSECALFHFKADFMLDGKVIKTINAEYGSVLSQTDIPQLEKRNGFTPHWDKDITKPILRNTVFTAIYEDATMTVSSGEEPPVMLVEGNFSEGSVLNYEKIETDDSYKGYDARATYSFTITPWNSTIGTIKVHIRDEKGDAIGVRSNDGNKVIQAKREGSYLVFELDKPESFTVLKKPTDIKRYVLIGFGAVIVSALFILFLRRIGKKRKEMYERIEGNE